VFFQGLRKKFHGHVLCAQCRPRAHRASARTLQAQASGSWLVERPQDAAWADEWPAATRAATGIAPEHSIGWLERTADLDETREHDGQNSDTLRPARHVARALFLSSESHGANEVRPQSVAPPAEAGPPSHQISRPWRCIRSRVTPWRRPPMLVLHKGGRSVAARGYTSGQRLAPPT
jgi:hypothetical protein